MVTESERNEKDHKKFTETEDDKCRVILIFEGSSCQDAGRESHKLEAREKHGTKL